MRSLWGGLVLRWRILLAQAGDGVVQAGRTAPVIVGRVADGVRSFAGSGGFTDVRHPAMAVYGATAVVTGALVGAYTASPGIPRLSALLAGTMSVVWAVIRPLVVRFVGPDLVAEDDELLRGALSVGLLGYVFAITPETRLLAWAVSAAVTGLLAVRGGLTRRRVWQVIALAWGAQAFVVIGEWIARNAFVAVLASRG